MQDIDFDEIDRAVNSVTNPEPVAPLEPAAQSISSHVTPSLAARRSSGRFMDVVHPSSDMRSAPPAGASFQREAVPTERIAVAERPVETSAPVAATPVETGSSAAFHWPDPIDLADDHLATPFTPPVAPEPTPAPVLDEAPDLDFPAFDLDDASQPSLESPFLTDAKVEKRPLGAFSLPESELPLIEDSPEEPVVVTENELPTERDEDILLLEADNEDAIEKVEDAEVIDSEVTDVKAVETAVYPAPVEETPVGPTSITQQYKEHPTTDSQASGAIYDTATYHQPLAHPAKKGSGLLVVVWIAALIALGGGIGAVVYFFVLPLL